MSEYRHHVAAAASVVDRRILVTGGGSGIGRAICRHFAAGGARVTVTDLVASAAEGTRQLCIEDGAAAERIFASALDVTDIASLEQAVQDSEAAMGGLSVLVNNAGIFQPSPLASADFDRMWRLSFDILLESQKDLVRFALPALRRQPDPRIVNIASTAGLGATPDHVAYVSAKHGVIGLTRALAVDLGRDGITVNAVCPGPIHTGITAGISDEEKALFAKRRTALRRYGEPEEIAHAVLFLCQLGAGFITGTTLVVDGGLTARHA